MSYTYLYCNSILFDETVYSVQSIVNETNNKETIHKHAEYTSHLLKKTRPLKLKFAHNCLKIKANGSLSSRLLKTAVTRSHERQRWAPFQCFFMSFAVK